MVRWFLRKTKDVGIQPGVPQTGNEQLWVCDSLTL